MNAPYPRIPVGAVYRRELGLNGSAVLDGEVFECRPFPCAAPRTDAVTRAVVPLTGWQREVWE